MKRSEINRHIKNAIAFFEEHHFKLPPFASWSQEDWVRNRKQIDEMIDCELGWDVTDFGRDDFLREGLLLFTIRNGKLNSSSYPKSYAEKIMISRDGQLTLMHCHNHKTEDIINRGGGSLVFRLYNREGEKGLADSDVTLQRDGVTVTVAAGETISLSPGESITLTPGVFHEFKAEGGDVLIGEVSAVNDDHNDNVFYHKQLRFPRIEEDEAPFRLLVGDCAK